MSDSTPTAPPIPRVLKSPFNGEAWTVPPDVTDVMYDELVKRGFEPISSPTTKRKGSTRDRD